VSLEENGGLPHQQEGIAYTKSRSGGQAKSETMVSDKPVAKGPVEISKSGLLMKDK
jgi:hypothetical protein